MRHLSQHSWLGPPTKVKAMPRSLGISEKKNLSRLRLEHACYLILQDEILTLGTRTWPGSWRRGRQSVGWDSLMLSLTL